MPSFTESRGRKGRGFLLLGLIPVGWPVSFRSSLSAVCGGDAAK
jgi:hypothetical protein